MIRFIFAIFIMLTIADTFISFMPRVRGLAWAGQFHRVVDLPQKPIRKILPPQLPIDLSPLVAILLFNLLMTLG